MLILITAIAYSQAKISLVPSPVATRPNILIVVTDDQRGGLSVMPQTRIFFGDGGTRFSRAYVTSPLCCPSRATLMTGQYPHNHGVRGNHGWKHLDQRDTLQYDLSQEGYHTAIFGKYLNWFPISKRAPGYFSDYGVFYTGGGAEYYRDAMWNLGGRIDSRADYSTDLIADEADRFIRERHRPWLMIVSVPAPHAPRTPEPRYADAPVGGWRGNPAVLEEDREDKPPWVRRFDVTIEQGRRIRREQLRTLMSVDDLVGRLRRALVATQQAKETLAFFVSDNGYLWGEHGLVGKPAPYLQTLEIPLLARWPGHFERGARARRLVSLADIAATIYDATGMDPGHKLDGHSLLRRHIRRQLLIEMGSRAKGAPPWRALITRDGSHYIEYHEGRRIVYREFYNLRSDPWENSNLAVGNPPPQAQRLSKLLRRIKRCHGNGCP